MPAPVATTLDIVLSAVKSKLIIDSVFTTSCCYLTLTPTVLEVPPDTVYAMIQPGRQNVDQPTFDGGGRVDLYFEGEINIVLMCRLALDQANRDDSWLTASTGALVKLSAIINSLTSYVPTDSNGDFLLIRPFRLMYIDKPAVIARAEGWGYITAVFSFGWQM